MKQNGAYKTPTPYSTRKRRAVRSEQLIRKSAIGSFCFIKKSEHADVRPNAFGQITGIESCAGDTGYAIEVTGIFKAGEKQVKRTVTVWARPENVAVLSERQAQEEIWWRALLAAEKGTPFHFKVGTGTAIGHAQGVVGTFITHGAINQGAEVTISDGGGKQTAALNRAAMVMFEQLI